MSTSKLFSGSGSSGSPKARRPPPWADTSWDANRSEFERALGANGLFLAEEDGEVVGFVSSWLEEHVARIGDVYVVQSEPPRGSRARPDRGRDRERASPRRHASHPEREPGGLAVLRQARLPRGVAQPRPCPSRCAPSAAAARSARSTSRPTTSARSSAPSASSCRGCRAARTAASSAPPRHGWIAVYDDVCDRDPSMLRRLARELSERTGAVVLALGVEHDQVVRFVLLEAGRIVDEYLSVPEHYGALPPGDVIALAANPRVVARLTGADPAQVRAVARTAPLPEELPPPQEPPRRHRRCDRARGHRARLGRRSGDPGRDRGATAVITLFDAARCPYCARVRIVLAEKDVPL